MLNDGPQRTSRPAEKRAVSRAEAAQPQPIEEPRSPGYRHTPYVPEPEKTYKRFLLPAIVAIVVIIIVATGLFMWSSMNRGASGAVGTAIDSSKYQAVFFTNGQVYFGKLKSFDAEYLKLTEVFYLQTNGTDGSSNNPQQTAGNDANNVQLIKLGNEIHGPQDEMIISKDQMLFFENLKDDGKVATSIGKYKNK